MLSRTTIVNRLVTTKDDRERICAVAIGNFLHCLFYRITRLCAQYVYMILYHIKCEFLFKRFRIIREFVSDKLAENASESPWCATRIKIHDRCDGMDDQPLAALAWCRRTAFSVFEHDANDRKQRKSWFFVRLYQFALTSLRVLPPVIKRSSSEGTANSKICIRVLVPPVGIRPRILRAWELKRSAKRRHSAGNPHVLLNEMRSRPFSSLSRKAQIQ